jgi:hypothetical protein
MTVDEQFFDEITLGSPGNGVLDGSAKKIPITSVHYPVAAANSQAFIDAY